MVFFNDERLLEALRHNLGPELQRAIEDEEVIEIMLNPDGKVWTERYGADQTLLTTLDYSQGQQILSLVADALDLIINSKNPIIEGEFPLDGSRFEGLFPPVVGPGPSFDLRKKASKVFTLSEYLRAGSITQEVSNILEAAILERQNIIVVGGTSSGKTTFVNAVIEGVSRLCPADRLLILEDTRELQCSSENVVFMHTSMLANISLRDLAKASMRYAPKRILVGEVRDAAALEMLKLWNTGHPGGVSTFHADSAEEALERLEELVEEAGVGSKQKLIGRAVDLVVYMEKTPDNQRRVSEIVKVKNFNPKEQHYETEMLYAA